MGAFGRLLIKSWGGNLKAYDNADSPSVREKTKKQLNEDVLEEDQHKFEMITQSCEQLVEKGNQMIFQLQGDEIISLLKTPKYQRKLETWRKEFFNKLNK